MDVGLEVDYVTWLKILKWIPPHIKTSCVSQKHDSNPIDAFPWGAWPRDAAVDTRKQAGA